MGKIDDSTSLVHRLVLTLQGNGAGNVQSDLVLTGLYFIALYRQKLSYRKLVTMQMILVQSNANEFCSVENVNLCKRFSTGCNLMLPSLTHGLITALTCLLYLCIKLMFLTLLKNYIILLTSIFGKKY